MISLEQQIVEKRASLQKKGNGQLIFLFSLQRTLRIPSFTYEDRKLPAPDSLLIHFSLKYWPSIHYKSSEERPLTRRNLIEGVGNFHYLLRVCMGFPLPQPRQTLLEESDDLLQFEAYLPSIFCVFREKFSCSCS